MALDLILFIVLVLLVLIKTHFLGLIKPRPIVRNDPEVPSGYVRCGRLLTAHEQQFWSLLSKSAAELGYRACFKPRAADLVKPGNFKEKEEWWQRFRYLSQRHIDFVLVDEAFVPVIAIELNDPSHRAPDRRKRDGELAAAFEYAGLPLLFIEEKIHQEKLTGLITMLVERSQAAQPRRVGSAA